MDRKDFIKELKEFAKPNFIKIISFIIILAVAGLGAIIIKNINSELRIREIASRFQQYKYSILSFNNVYSGLPGDINNATFYWKDVTENGDADRKIGFNNKETILAWQHLQLAKLLTEENDRMSGKWYEGKDEVIAARYNAPQGTIENSVFYITYSNDLQSNIIGLARNSLSKGTPDKPVLTPEDAYNLDLIIDDGYPDKGNIISASSGDNQCNLAGEYKMERDSEECLIFNKI